MRRALARFLLLAATLVVAFAAPPARAGMIADCADVRLFEKTPVNVVILPYTYATNATRPLSPAARKLSLLIQQDSLFEMIKYERIAVVNLVETTRPCVFDQVWSAVRAATERNAGAAVVMLWGRVYEEDDQLFVQTYVRFLRPGAHETITKTVATTDGPATFTGSLPSGGITFPARRIALADLASIGAEFERASQVHKEPREGSPVVRVNGLSSGNAAPWQPFGYGVGAVRGDWMQIIPYGSNQDQGGWIHARVADRWPLRDRLPELFFVDAVVGYLQYRIANESTVYKRPTASKRYATDATRSLANYTQRTDTTEGAQTGPVVALGQALLGTLQFLGGDDRAERTFAAAVAAQPYNGDLRNLQNVGRVARWTPDGAGTGGGAYGRPAASRGAATRVRPLMKSLLDAIAAEPANPDAVPNLASFHRVVAGSGDAVGAIGADELARQRAILQSMRAN